MPAVERKIRKLLGEYENRDSVALSDGEIAFGLNVPIGDVYRVLEHLRDTEEVCSYWSMGAWYHSLTAKGRAAYEQVEGTPR